MGVDVIESFLLYSHVLDGFVLHLAHALDAVFNSVFNARKKRAVRPSGARTNNGIVVGESVYIVSGGKDLFR